MYRIGIRNVEAILSIQMLIVSLLPVDRHYKGCVDQAQCGLKRDYTLQKVYAGQGMFEIVC